MGSIFRNLKSLSDRRKQKKAAREKRKAENKVNRNPTEEDLKNNKNRKIAIVLSILSCVLYIVVLSIIVSAFKSNIFIGFISIILIPLVTLLQQKAVEHAKTQREINGKGFFTLIFAKYLVPLFALCAILLLIFGIGLLI